MAESTLQLELHKLSCVKSEETLDSILRSLWKSRKTGLRGPEKSHLQSLLHLSSPSELHPVMQFPTPFSFPSFFFLFEKL